MFARVLAAFVLVGCGGAATPPTPPAPAVAADTIAVIEVPRVASAARPAPTANATPDDTTVPRQAVAADGTPAEAPPRAEPPRILVPCPPSAPNCGVLATLSSGNSGSRSLGTGGGGIGMGTIGLGNVGNMGTTQAPIRVPKPSAGTEVALRSSSNPIANSGAVVAGMRAGFRRCYNRLLSQDPSAHGSVFVRIEVLIDGSVSKATATSNAILAGARPCIEARAASAKFAPPDSGKASTLNVEIKLTPPPPSSP